MQSRAFLFDMDGVICNSHPIQVRALEESMKDLTKKYKYNCSFENLEETLTEIIQGSDENNIFNDILIKYPVFKNIKKELVENSWYKYKELRNVNLNFPIKSSLVLLKILVNLGYRICIVSNAKKDSILENIKLLGLESYLCSKDNDNKHPYCGYEDFVGYPKPNPQPYLTAAKKLGIDPNFCVVFEDSPNGIKSAKAAGMYVVELNKKKKPIKKPADIFADEKVSNLLHTNFFNKTI